MSGVSHTPGPWHYDERNSTTFEINASNGDPTLGYKSWTGLAHVYGSVDELQKGRKLARANARLIAAAPCLLARLESMAAQHACGCGHPACKRCADDRRNQEVIARAKGDD